MSDYTEAIDAIEELFARSTPPQIRPEEVSTVIIDVAEALKAEIDAIPGGGGGGGSVATDTIFDAKGDLAVGTGSDTASRLAVGSNGQVLTADSGEATGLKWTTVAGTGDVTAASNFGTDNVLVRADGTGKGVQATGISVADTTNDVTGMGTLACGAITSTGPLSIGTSNAATVGSIEIGDATDTTIARSGAGDITIEGNAVYRAGGTDVPLADGGTGASLTDPNADRILFWDDSAGAVTWLEAGSGLTITGTTLSASGGGSGDVTAASTIPDNEIVRGDGGSKGVQGSGITIDDSKNVTGVAALSATTIELGAVSDTTLSRASAGNLAIEGTIALKGGVHSIWIPAHAMVSRTTNGAAAGSVEMTTNKNMFKTLDFDTTTQEFAQFFIQMPKSWDEGTVTFNPVWSHPSTTTNFGVVFGLAGVAISNDDAGDVAFGTAQTSTDTGGTTNDIYVGPTSSAITIAGTPAESDYVMFQINRTVSDGSDTMAVDARLHGIMLNYTVAAANDA